MSESVTTLRFEGVAKIDGCNPERIMVGDRSVIGEIIEALGYGKFEAAVQVTDGDTLVDAEGKLDVDPGIEGYGTYTPGENARFCVGETDVLSLLEKWEDKVVVVDAAFVGIPERPKLPPRPRDGLCPEMRNGVKCRKDFQHVGDHAGFGIGSAWVEWGR